MTTLQIVAACVAPAFPTFYLAARYWLREATRLHPFESDASVLIDTFIIALIFAAFWPVGLVWLLVMMRSGR